NPGFWINSTGYASLHPGYIYQLSICNNVGLSERFSDGAKFLDTAHKARYVEKSMKRRDEKISRKAS
ncbi:TPA: hypothetical protein ACPSKZ_001116, partial [Legionella anisa]